MTGQMKSFKEKQNMVDEFVSQMNIYETQPLLKFDFHGYAKYVKENNLTNQTITDSVMNHFLHTNKTKT